MPDLQTEAAFEIQLSATVKKPEMVVHRILKEVNPHIPNTNRLPD